MNIFEGVIKDILVNQNLSLIEVQVKKYVLTTIVIDTPETNATIKVGNPVQLIFKETEVVIATGNVDNVSLRNKIAGEIMKIEKGILLSKLYIHTDIGEVVSLITSKAVIQLALKKGKKVIAMIKTNEIMMSS